MRKPQAIYRVMQSKRETLTIVSILNLEYPAMIQSGNYEEIFEGTKAECESFKEEQQEIESQVDENYS